MVKVMERTCGPLAMSSVPCFAPLIGESLTSFTVTVALGGMLAFLRKYFTTLSVSCAAAGNAHANRTAANVADRIHHALVCASCISSSVVRGVETFSKVGCLRCPLFQDRSSRGCGQRAAHADVRIAHAAAPLPLV